MPEAMIAPSPPKPANEAIVAVATTMSTPARSPPMITGAASGSSTFVRICHSVMPEARAASTVTRSTDSMPA